ncbi:MAG: alpha/beta fold hydrolase [Chthonomonas sp.]|nr:alpha/beta fold hydrolase [Chthonomonas sp.]
MNILAIVILALLVIYLAILLGVSWFSLHPLRIPIFLSPGALGLPQESVAFKSKDGVPLRGWWIDQENPRAVAVLAHGFLMNRAEPTPMAKRLFEEGFACLLFDFRRHGLSGGKISTVGWAERHDVAAAVALARERYPGVKLVLWGSSMGAAAAALAVAHEPDCHADALILDSAYSRLVDATGGWWKTFVGPVVTFMLMPTWVLGWLFTRIDPRGVDVADALSRLQQPILLLHGDADMIVPLEAAKRNQRANELTELVVFEGMQHSQPRWQQTATYDARVMEFLRKNGILTDN